MNALAIVLSNASPPIPELVYPLLPKFLIAVTVSGVIWFLTPIWYKNALRDPSFVEVSVPIVFVPFFGSPVFASITPASTAALNILSERTIFPFVSVTR